MVEVTLGIGIPPGHCMLGVGWRTQEPEARRKTVSSYLHPGIFSINCDTTVGKVEIDWEFLSPQFW
jgi:hypothetical protein